MPKKHRKADGTLKPSRQRAVDQRRVARAEQRVHIMGLACAFHAREQVAEARQHISMCLARISDEVSAA